MQVNICPPFLHGVKVTSRMPGRLEMTVVVRGTFRLAPGEPVAPIDDLAKKALQGDRFGEGDDDRTGALVHPSDFADFKLKTDVLLRGTCYPGEGRSVPVCTARFSVGSWSKSLRIFGRRTWTTRAMDPISDPVPFTSMPITYENAFGGPEFARNPVGKGWKTAELPNVEDPAALLGSRRQTPEPAGFGPLSPNWPQRSSKLGTDYGKTWKKTRAPFYAADFDWSHFNSAPSDQQLEGYLRGDEPLVFEYLHPRAIRFTARLPGIRPRVLCTRTDGTVTEVPTSLDTLIADVDGEVLVLLWRGLAKVTDTELEDVRTLFLGCEPLDAPRPVEHYMAELEAFEKDPIAYLRDQLAPAAAKKHIEEAKKQAAKASEDAAASSSEASKAADVASDPAAHAEALLAAHAKDGSPTEVVDRLRAFLKDTKANLPDLKAQALAQTSFVPSVAGMVDAMSKMLATQKAAAIARGISTERIDAAEAQLAKVKDLQADGPSSPLADADAAAAAAMKAEGAASPAAADEAPGPRKNLIGRDFSGWDLAGADLRGALLRDAKLVGTKLAGANLSGADLGGADLRDADLAGADLSQANLTGSVAPGVSFEGATLSRTLFVKTDLTGASLAGAHGTMTVFQETALASARLGSVKFHKAYFGKAVIERADFGKAELDTCTFFEVSADGARFDEVRLSKTAFLRSKMSSASFVEASGEGCSWQGSTLDGADFRFARLRRAQLNKASLVRANLHASDFAGGRFERASLAEADFGEANLMSVSFNKAKLAATDFSNASLYDAKFLGTVAGAKCNFEGANLKLAVWEQP